MDRESLLRIAHGRLHPSLRNPNYLVLRSRRLIFSSHLKTLPDNLLILDVGGRYQPYRPLIAGKVRSYFSLDIVKTDYVNVVGSGESIPFRDETFDLVIATCVFDYMQKPHEAAKEICRVLKLRGSLLASFGAAVPRFGDEECWRYLPRGLQSLFSSFSQVDIVPEVSSLGGFCRLMNLGFRDFVKFPVLKFAYDWTVCPMLNLLGLGLESARLTAHDNWAGNYSVIAVK